LYSSIKTVGATVLGGVWALEWAWHSAETNLRCVRSSGICTPNLNSLAQNSQSKFLGDLLNISLAILSIIVVLKNTSDLLTRKEK